MEVQQIRDQVVDKAQIFQGKVKRSFDKKAKPDDFQKGDLVLKWDAWHEGKGKHGKFKHLWKGPYEIVEDCDNNSYVLRVANGDFFPGGLVNGQLLKHYLTPWRVTCPVDYCKYIGFNFYFQVNSDPGGSFSDSWQSLDSPCQVLFLCTNDPNLLERHYFCNRVARQGKELIL